METHSMEHGLCNTIWRTPGITPQSHRRHKTPLRFSRPAHQDSQCSMIAQSDCRKTNCNSRSGIHLWSIVEPAFSDAQTTLGIDRMPSTSLVSSRTGHANIVCTASRTALPRSSTSPHSSPHHAKSSKSTSQPLHDCCDELGCRRKSHRLAPYALASTGPETGTHRHRLLLTGSASFSLISGTDSVFP